MNYVNTGIGLNKTTLVVKLVVGVRYLKTRVRRWCSTTTKTTKTKLDIDLSIFVGVEMVTKFNGYYEVVVSKLNGTKTRTNELEW